MAGTSQSEVTGTLPRTYTLKEVQQILRVSHNTAYELVRRGDLPSFRIGRAIRVSAEALQQFMDGREE